MDVEIDGKKQTVPICTCGKCLVKRAHKNFNTNFPYNKNLGTTYSTDFPCQSQPGKDEMYNRSKHSAFEGVVKEHLPSSLVSTMRNDYKPFKVKIDEDQPTQDKVKSAPFFGRSSYTTEYPDWGSTLVGKEKPEVMPDIKVPLRGQAHYKENFPKYDDNFYKKREPINFAKDTLQFFGKVNPETTYGNSFQPVDFKQEHYFPNESYKKTDIEKTTFIPTDFPTPDTLYQSEYKKHDTKCKLAEYLKRLGMAVLEI
jgi:hypothetical protein